MPEVETLIRELVDDLAADDPVLATQLGLVQGGDRLPSFRTADIAARRVMLRRHQERLLPLLAHPDREVVIDAFAGLQVVRRGLRALDLQRAPSRRPALFLDAVAGLYPLLVRELGGHNERLAALAGRLAAVPALLEQAKELLEPGLPRLFVEAGIDYAAGMRELAGPAVRGFAAQAGRPGELDTPSAAAVAALDRFAAFLRDELLPGSSAESAAGEDVLADVLRWEHALPDGPDELAAYGREILDETEAAMAETAGAMGFADAAAAVAAVQRDTPDPDALVAAYQSAVEAARDYVAARGIATLPEGEELTVMATPSFLRTLVPFAAYDPPGPFDPRQLGLYYVTPPHPNLRGDELDEAMRMHPRASLPTTGVHEAYPGHHLQLVRANRASTLARRVAHIPQGASLLIEGWAFYCEEMMEREGFLAEPAVRLMRLNDQVWRACRVVIDVELHLGRMSAQAAAAMLVERAHMNPYEAGLEVRRYAEEPGQPLSYLVGRREVLRLAAAWREHRSGSLRDFHDELLAWGSLPPAVIAWGMGVGPRPPALTSQASS